MPLQYKSTRMRYSVLTNSDDDETGLKKSSFHLVRDLSQKLRCFLSSLVVIILCAAIAIFGITLFRWLGTDIGEYSTECKEYTIRREWRSLSKMEKTGYIQAVQCLQTKPSVLGLNQTLYDDFPWVHSQMSAYAHGAAPFLSWHRYFLQIYERMLREHCGYDGHLTYWNWALDWKNITESPVWSQEYGFGGNGDRNKGQPILHGHCVVDGPFAGLRVLYLSSKFKPHCLSRGFESGEGLHKLGQRLRPELLEKLTHEPNYETFNLGLEEGPHLAVPNIIRGDFLLFTAPNDPVFFLHHTQLDRIWWMWQQADPRKRRMSYNGKASQNSTESASLTDLLPMLGLAQDITVASVMRTDSELLCYRY